MNNDDEGLWIAFWLLLILAGAGAAYVAYMVLR